MTTDEQRPMLTGWEIDIVGEVAGSRKESRRWVGDGLILLMTNSRGDSWDSHVYAWRKHWEQGAYPIEQSAQEAAEYQLREMKIEILKDRNSTPLKMHTSECPTTHVRMKMAGNHLFDYVDEDGDGRLVVSACVDGSERTQPVNFCPWCGFPGVPW